MNIMWTFSLYNFESEKFNFEKIYNFRINKKTIYYFLKCINIK